MKSDFRFESLKGKFSSNPLDQNLMIGCPKRNRGGYTKKAFELGLQKPALKFNSGLELEQPGPLPSLMMHVLHFSLQSSTF